MICVQAEATDPIVRAFRAGDLDITPRDPGPTLATGLNVARNVGHINVLRIIRDSGGAAVTVTDAQIRETIRTEWQARRFAWSPEGAATLACLPELADLHLIQPGDRVVLVNTASPEKYLPHHPQPLRRWVLSRRLSIGTKAGILLGAGLVSLWAAGHILTIATYKGKQVELQALLLTGNVALIVAGLWWAIRTAIRR